MLKPILTVLLLSTPLFAAVPSSGNTQIIKTNKGAIQQKHNPRKNQGMQEVFAQIRKISPENKTPRLLTPQIEEITFKKAIADGQRSLESNEIFHILWKSGVMKPLPPNTESTFLGLGDDAITTNFGKIIIRTGGFFSQAIYEVILAPEYATNPDNAHFIIKQIGWGNIEEGDKVKKRTQATPTKEIQDLNLVKQVLEPQFLELSQNPFFPKMALHNTTFFYFDDRGRKNYISVLPVVQGASARSTIENNSNTTQINETMERIGRSLGEFHYKLASQEQRDRLSSTLDFNNFRTIIHDDFHLDNIFLSDQNVSFIDNASIANSLRTPQSPLRDIVRLYTINLYLYNMESNPLNFNKIKDSFNAFIEGYIQAYPHAEQYVIRQTIAETLKTLDDLIKEDAQRIKVASETTNKLDNVAMITEDSIEKIKKAITGLGDTVPEYTEKEIKLIVQKFNDTIQEWIKARKSQLSLKKSPTETFNGFDSALINIKATLLRKIRSTTPVKAQTWQNLGLTLDTPTTPTTQNGFEPTVKNTTPIRPTSATILGYENTAPLAPESSDSYYSSAPISGYENTAPLAPESSDIYYSR